MIVSPMEQGMNAPGQMRIPSDLPRFKWVNERLTESNEKKKDMDVKVDDRSKQSKEHVGGGWTERQLGVST